jgi:hypothetical protein
MAPWARLRMVLHPFLSRAPRLKSIRAKALGNELGRPVA